MKEHDTQVAENFRSYKHYHDIRTQRDQAHVRASIIALIVVAILFSAAISI